MRAHTVSWAKKYFNLANYYVIQGSVECRP